MKTFFSSDYHLGHKNIIKYDKRPFTTVDEMDEAIINNHNKVIGADDEFYFLGDFSFDKSKTEWYLSRLNGNKYFIKGNHDYNETVELYKQYGTYLGHMEEINIKGQKITLCHYAMRCWNRSHHGSLHLYGHSHHSLTDDATSLSFDVGINGKDYFYTPLSFDQVMKKMSVKKFKAIDHHTGRHDKT